MKNAFKSLAAAAAVLCATPALAQGSTTSSPSAAATSMADEICAELAADKEIQITCTAEQKKQIAELFDRVAAMEVTDRYSAMAQEYELNEGIRKIFFPATAPAPKPPTNIFEETAMSICAQKKQATGVDCTSKQTSDLIDFARRVSAMPKVSTVEELQARQQMIRDELNRIFPEMTIQTAPKGDVAPIVRMNIA